MIALLCTLALSAVQKEPAPKVDRQDLEARLDQLHVALKEADNDDKRAAIKEEIAKLESHLAKGAPQEGKKHVDKEPAPKLDRQDLEVRLDELHAALKQTDNDEKHAAIKAEIEKIHNVLSKGAPQEGKKHVDLEPRLKDLHAALEKTEDVEKRAALKEEIAKLESHLAKGAPHEGKKHPESKYGVGDPAEARVNQILAQMKGSEGDKRAALMAQLREAVGEFFDGRIQRRQKELQELHAKIAAIQETMRAQQANREALIEQRVNELIGEKKGLQFPE